jgi:molybdate transport system substrate-binding protein
VLRILTKGRTEASHETNGPSHARVPTNLTEIRKTSNTLVIRSKFQFISQWSPVVRPCDCAIIPYLLEFMLNWKKLAALFLIAASAQLLAAQEITVAAAADLQFAMFDLGARFQKDSGINVKLLYGSSGNFAQQIQNGAPFDMFFSANLDYPKQLQAAGLTEPDSFYGYAKGKLVLWVPNESKLDLSSGLKVLLNPAVKKIAIANPQHAPYGQAAQAALQHENVYDKVKDKLVLGENISQTASFVTSGAADVGLVALSLALSPNMKDHGRYLEIPSDDYSPIDQACVILRSSKNKDAARKFLAFIKTPMARQILRDYGFEVPKE